MSAEQRLKLGGHRGLGCTDHASYGYRDLAALPVENTLESIEAAYRSGADYIETDAVMSGDGVVFTLHNVVPEDHFFADPTPQKPLNEMAFSDIKRFKTGRKHSGEIGTLGDMLEIVAANDPKTLPWAINIEIKGVQGSQQPYESNDYLDKIAESVRQSSLPEKRVLFSSFCLENILRMSRKMPAARYGMLFSEKKGAAPIYADHQDDPRYRYLPFNVEQITFVCDEWQKHSQAKLEYLHPEILTIGEAQLDLAAEKGMGVNCWAIFETYNENRAEIYQATIAKATERNVPFTVITDYLEEMKALQNDSAVRAISPV